MSYLEKEVEMLKAMQSDNFNAFHGNKDQALNFMSRKLRAFPDYMDVVIRQQTMIPIWKIQCDPQEFREKCQDIDQSRRINHDDAIASVNGLNRLCKKLNLEPFSTVDTTDRYAVADMIQDYCSEVYQTGISTQKQPERRREFNVQEHMQHIQEKANQTEMEI